MANLEQLANEIRKLTVAELLQLNRMLEEPPDNVGVREPRNPISPVDSTTVMRGGDYGNSSN